MLSEAIIDEVVDSPALRDFGRFVLSHAKSGKLPDYKAMDLMQIPRLVPDIWVYDLRDDEKFEQLFCNFCGTRIEDYWQQQFQGTTDMAFLGNNSAFQEILNHRISCIRNKKTGYSKRFMEYEGTDQYIKYTKAECLFFPCAADNGTVNWTIGCATYENTLEESESVFLEF